MPLHETMRLAEARLVRHAPGGSMCPPKLGNTVKYRVEEMRPKWPFWKHRAHKMRLVEAQCAHRKHCYPETSLGSHPTSRSHKNIWGNNVVPQISRCNPPFKSGVAQANQTKERSVHELFAGAFRNKSSMCIVLVFLRRNTRIHEKWAKFMNFSFWPFLWFGLPGRLLIKAL